MTTSLRIDIVGGGIGGIALAASLSRLGLRCQVFEQAPQLKAVGYGLTLQKNAIQALETVGLGDLTRRRGLRIDTGQIRQPGGRVLGRARVDLCAMHRATLLTALAEHVPTEWVHVGSRATTATDADVVVAADGLHSVFRTRIAAGEGRPRDCGYTAWRGLTHRSPEIDRAIEAGVVSETWGRGLRFGVVPIDDDRIYWFAVSPVDPLRDAREAHAYLRTALSGWHAPVAALLDATPSDTILESRIVDRLPIDRWHDDRVILLGDAAHPMTPNLGQGGCQAIEDAVVLAHLLRACADGHFRRDQVALRYEAQRMRRVHDIVSQSFRLGSLARRTNPAVVAIRDAVLRMNPSRVQERQLRDIVTFPGVAD